MRKSRFSEKQNVKMARETERRPVAEVAKKPLAERDLEVEVMKAFAAREW